MARRRSNKKARLPQQQKSEMSGASGSSSSLSSGGRRRMYRWRYLQLIKDGLVWLTGKRTRGVRISESAIAASNREGRRRAVSPTRVASLRFKAIRGVYKEDRTARKGAQLKRGRKGKRTHGNARSRSSTTKSAGLKRGRRKNAKVAGLKRNRKAAGSKRNGKVAGLKKSRKVAGLKRKTTVARLERKPTEGGGQGGRMLTGRPRGRPRKLQSTNPDIFLGGGRQRIVTAMDDGPTSSVSPGHTGTHSSPKRAGGKRTLPSGGPRSSRIVARNVSRGVLTRKLSPLNNRSPNRDSSKSSLFD